MDLCVMLSCEFGFIQLKLEPGAALLVSLDLSRPHLCSARPLDHQIISGRPPENKQVNHIRCDFYLTQYHHFITSEIDTVMIALD